MEAVSITIAAIGLFVAVQALLMAVYLKFVDKMLVEQKSNIADILKNKHLIEFNHSLITNVLTETSSSLRFFSSNIKRFSDKTLDNDTTNSISRELREYDIDLQKKILELLLINEDQTKRDSAIRELSEEYGDFETLLLMKECYKQVFYEDCPPLERGILTLYSRLSACKCFIREQI